MDSLHHLENTTSSRPRETWIFAHRLSLREYTCPCYSDLPQILLPKRKDLALQSTTTLGEEGKWKKKRRREGPIRRKPALLCRCTSNRHNLSPLFLGDSGFTIIHCSILSLQARSVNNVPRNRKK